MHGLTSLRGRFRTESSSLPIPACAEYANSAFPFFGVPGPFEVYFSADVWLGLWDDVGERRMCRENVHELEKQVGGGDTHGTGHVLSDVCASQRRCGARRGLGAVSDDRGGLGDFCFVVCEVEVGGSVGGANSVGLIGWRCDARGRVLYGRLPRAYGDAKGRHRCALAPSSPSPANARE